LPKLAAQSSQPRTLKSDTLVIFSTRLRKSEASLACERDRGKDEPNHTQQPHPHVSGISPFQWPVEADREVRRS